ncbi:hydrolase [Parashewanella curva]|uniref:Hydrolase n=1 Tax=Parashewanella curva TaxID=2338552 RepID=A0A3L8PS35_9GAMM|nr:hydrolase [Parashewanella curva]RLV58211.1 hydrolase [Parashewanella curva]
MSKFRPPRWARSPHVQTILPVLTKVKLPPLQRERLTLNDGDFIDLDWLGTPQKNQPIVVILHGLEGSSDSHYVRRILNSCQQSGLAAVVHHHRSCSGEQNVLPRSYHSGDTVDISHMFTNLKAQFPDSPLFAVGYSLGGNMLAKYLGEQQQQSLIERAIVVSAPLKLSACAKRLEKGFSRIYQSHLIKQLQSKLIKKIETPAFKDKMPVTKERAPSLNSFYEFDDKVTAPLHGFKGVDDYYLRASGLPYLATISVPTLILHAKDDPFMTDEVIPTAEHLSDFVQYELAQHGGHVGFINGGNLLNPSYYLEPKIIGFLLSH